MPNARDKADRRPLLRVGWGRLAAPQAAVGAMVTRRALGRVQAVHLLGAEAKKASAGHQPHAASSQAIHERRELGPFRMETRQRFHHGKEGIVDQFFWFGLGASVAIEFDTDGPPDLVSHGEQKALALIPNAQGIGGLACVESATQPRQSSRRLFALGLHGVSFWLLRVLRKKRKPLVWLPVMALATALSEA